ncbi:MAG: hypothetical protein KDC98_07825 [Planctomycetes bacterium]|nr:hypothetical protein [Planctomycetota bacterium]
MKPEPSPRCRWRRRCLALFCLLSILSTSGCGLVLDEFCWLDVPPIADADAATVHSVP